MKNLQKIVMIFCFYTYCILPHLFPKHAHYKYQLTLVGMFYNEVPYLKEWVEYHRMIGVDHFLLYDDGSQDNWKAILYQYICDGFVEVINWPEVHAYAHIPKEQQDWQELQRQAYKDALKRSRGKSTWLVFLDLDEFLVPLQGTVKYSLDTYFSKAAGIYVNWRHFGTGGITLEQGASKILHLHACSEQDHPTNAVGKSIVKPDCVDIDAVWNVHHFPLKDGFFYYNGNRKKLLFSSTNDLLLDGKHYENYFRINHYRMGDERFFKEVRLARTERLQLPTALLWEHYHAFNKRQDTTTITALKKYYPEAFQAFIRLFS